MRALYVKNRNKLAFESLDVRFSFLDIILEAQDAC